MAATAFLAVLTLTASGVGGDGVTRVIVPVRYPLSAHSKRTLGRAIEVAAERNADLTVLRFDPQGTLPEQNILAALETDEIQLTLTLDREAQIVYRDPDTQLIVTIPGSFRPLAEGIRLEWASNSQYRQLFLSRTMEYSFNPASGTLVFDADAPDGVSRARLLELVPAFQGEQLLDPTPGALTVTFTSI